MNNKPRSLYIHIPFCEKICDYCDFTKLQYFRKFAIPYLDALEKELKSYEIEGLKTIYIGGGTPTALDDDLFEKLLKIVYFSRLSITLFKIYKINLHIQTFKTGNEILNGTSCR